MDRYYVASWTSKDEQEWIELCENTKFSDPLVKWLAELSEITTTSLSSGEKLDKMDLCDGRASTEHATEAKISSDGALFDGLKSMSNVEALPRLQLTATTTDLDAHENTRDSGVTTEANAVLADLRRRDDGATLDLCPALNSSNVSSIDRPAASENKPGAAIVEARYSKKRSPLVKARSDVVPELRVGTSQSSPKLDLERRRMVETLKPSKSVWDTPNPKKIDQVLPFNTKDRPKLNNKIPIQAKQEIETIPRDSLNKNIAKEDVNMDVASPLSIPAKFEPRSQAHPNNVVKPADRATSTAKHTSTTKADLQHRGSSVRAANALSKLGPDTTAATSPHNDRSSEPEPEPPQHNTKHSSEEEVKVEAAIEPAPRSRSRLRIQRHFPHRAEARSSLPVVPTSARNIYESTNANDRSTIHQGDHVETNYTTNHTHNYSNHSYENDPNGRPKFALPLLAGALAFESGILAKELWDKTQVPSKAILSTIPNVSTALQQLPILDVKKAKIGQEIVKPIKLEDKTEIPPAPQDSQSRPGDFELREGARPEHKPVNHRADTPPVDSGSTASSAKHAIDSKNKPLTSEFTESYLIEEIDEDLSNGFPVTHLGDEEQPMLHFATRMGYETVVKHLILLGTNVNLGDDLGCTALILAAQHGHRTIANLLLYWGAKANFKTASGISALFAATMSRDVQMVHTLLRRGARAELGPINLVALAAIMNEYSIVEVLLQSSRSGALDAVCILAGFCSRIANFVAESKTNNYTTTLERYYGCAAILKQGYGSILLLLVNKCRIDDLTTPSVQIVFGELATWIGGHQGQSMIQNFLRTTNPQTKPNMTEIELETHYRLVHVLGLLYYDCNKFDKALECLMRAYSGFVRMSTAGSQEMQFETSCLLALLLDHPARARALTSNNRSRSTYTKAMTKFCSIQSPEKQEEISKTWMHWEREVDLKVRQFRRVLRLEERDRYSDRLRLIREMTPKFREFEEALASGLRVEVRSFEELVLLPEIKLNDIYTVSVTAFGRTMTESPGSLDDVSARSDCSDQ